MLRARSSWQSWSQVSWRTRARAWRPTWATNQAWGRVFAGLGLITGLFFATGLCIPRGIAIGGLIGIGLGLPRRRLGACGFNYHMLSNGPLASITQAVPKVPPIGVTNCADVSEPLSQAASAMAPVASTQEASTANWPSEAYRPKKQQSSPDPLLAAATCEPVG